VVLFGKGSGAGFPFGKAAISLTNTALPGSGDSSTEQYITISGSLGSTAVATVVRQAGKGGAKAKRTIKGISFPASAVADGSADISKGSKVASNYGNSIIVVP
jgi:hypothetical protein